ncbi:MinD/ParA family protein [Sphaerotilus sp.]|uniref:MinD/ParA family protein n=1 Tax=Sphaerotilus sp. TaxID=2093942 RepID=UPI002ACDDB9A|nr:MinD/ParA family protein [Sphaerotilus sp.]MDZ7857755.1 MinD/ParA family protein [Sphaerotilus sp.]
MSVAHILAITSGKGGVGKTMLSANLAAALARRGEKVLVIDADLGLANLDVVLNLHPRTTLHDVFTGKAPLDQAVIDAPGGFQVLLAGSGLIEYSRLTPQVREQLALLLDTVRPRYDRVLIDTGAGISDIVLYAVSLADEVLVIATPEPTALADAYATIKVLAAQQDRTTPMLVVNQTQRPGEGAHVATQLQAVLRRFVQRPDGTAITLQALGDIALDPAVRQSVQKRQLLMLAYPGADAASDIREIAGRLAEATAAARLQSGR